MADDPKNTWTNLAEKGATFPPTQVSTTDPRDYETWANESGGWRKILAAVNGGAALETQSGKDAAKHMVDAQSLADAAVAFQQTQETLTWLKGFLRDQAHAIAGKDKAWRGPAAESFLKEIELLADWVGAQAERISGAAGTGGINSVPNQLYKSAEYLVWAQNAMSYLDSAWATVAANNGTHQNSAGMVAITGTPYEKPMTEQFVKVVGDLAGQYEFTYSNVTKPDSSTAPTGPQNVPPPDLKTTPPPGSGSSGPGFTAPGLPNGFNSSGGSGGPNAGTSKFTPPVTPDGPGSGSTLPTTSAQTRPEKLPTVPTVTTPGTLPNVSIPPLVTSTRPGVSTSPPGSGTVFKPPVIPSTPGSGGNSGTGGPGGGFKPPVIPSAPGTGGGVGSVKPPALPSMPGGTGSPFHPGLGTGVDIPGVKSPGAGGSFPGSGGMPMTPGAPGAGGSGSGVETPDAGGLLKGDASDWEPGIGGVGVPDGSEGALPGGGNLGLSPSTASFPGAGGMPMTPGAPGAGGGNGSTAETPDAGGLVQGDAADWQSDAGVPALSAGAVPGGIGLSPAGPGATSVASRMSPAPMMPGGMPNSGRPESGEATKPDASGLVEADAVDWATTDLTVDVPGTPEGVEAGGAQLGAGGVPAEVGGTSIGIPAGLPGGTPAQATPPRQAAPGKTAPEKSPSETGELASDKSAMAVEPAAVPTPGPVLGVEPIAAPVPPRPVLVTGAVPSTGGVPSTGVVTAPVGEVDERTPLDRPEAAQLLHSDVATWHDGTPGEVVPLGDDYVPVISAGDDDMSGWDDVSESGWLTGALDESATRED